MDHEAQSTEHDAEEGLCSMGCHLENMLGTFMLLMVIPWPHPEVRASTEFPDQILSFI